MAQNIVSSVSIESGADLGFLKDQNMLTIAGVALGATTLGATSLVGALTAPGATLSGLLMTGACVGGGHLKKTTGSYLPFLGDKKDETPVVEATVAV